MCEYQRVKSNKPPVCAYTGKLCTFCVLGNSKTYNQAELAKKVESNRKVSNKNARK